MVGNVGGTHRHHKVKVFALAGDFIGDLIVELYARFAI